MRSLEEIIDDRKTAVEIAERLKLSDWLRATYRRNLSIAEKAKARQGRGQPWAAKVIERDAENYAMTQR